MIRRPIRNRLILVGVIVVTAIIGAAGLIIEMQRLASIDAYRTAIVNLGNGMTQQTTQAILSVDQALSEIQTEVTSIPNATPDQIQRGMRQKSIFDHLIDQKKRLPGADSLLLVDPGGTLVNTSREWPSAATDLSGRDFFSHFRATDDQAVFVGVPVKNPATGAWTAFMARRINDRQGGLAGVVVAEISLTRLQEFYRLAMPTRRSVSLLRSDGVILVRFPVRDDDIGRKIPAQSPWYRIVAQGGGSYHATGYFDGLPAIAAVQPLRNLPFVVEATVRDSVTLHDWYQQRLWVVFGCISAIISVVLLLRLFAVQYRRIEASEMSLAVKNAQLDTAHQQLDATLANLSLGVCFFNVDQQVVVCNRRYSELFGLPGDTIRPGMSLREITELRVAAGTFFNRTIDDWVASITALVRHGQPVDDVFEVHSGQIISGHLQPLPGRGWIVTNEDITARRRAEAEAAFLARHDALTGLANRSLFQERLEQALLLAERGKGFAVLCLDLDRFKAVNDTLGHPIGDLLLRAVAGRLLAVMRESDTVARLGGDEFAILQLEVSEATETTVVSRRIVQSISEPFDIEGNEVNVGTSIGIAMAPGDSSQAAQLMKHADLALYRSKQEGRGTWRFFEPAMDAVATKRRILEADLRNALAAGRLQLYYQPLVSSQTRTLSAFEALLRWDHPTRGLLSADEFLSVADEIGIITEIGAWVLHRACADAASWPDGLRVAVNLAARQLRGGTLVDSVMDALRNAGLSPDRLDLEISESVPLQRDKAAAAMLHDLRAAGSRIALDDFGTGSASLSYLRGFPFDAIKVDRSLVADLEMNDKSGPLIRGIIGLATNLGMAITAEGVETEAQFAFLADAGCTEIQGYLISRPVPATEVPALIRQLSARKPMTLTAFAPVVG